MYYQYELAHFKGNMGDGATSDVADGFFSIMQIFQYLGSLTSYNLPDDNGITARIKKHGCSAIYFVGKIIQARPDRPSCNIITACCNHNP